MLLALALIVSLQHPTPPDPIATQFVTALGTALESPDVHVVTGPTDRAGYIVLIVSAPIMQEETTHASAIAVIVLWNDGRPGRYLWSTNMAVPEKSVDQAVQHIAPQVRRVLTENERRRR